MTFSLKHTGWTLLAWMTLLGCACLFSPAAHAQEPWFLFDPADYSVTIDFDAFYRSGDERATEWGYEFEERLSWRKRGAILDERIVRFNIFLEPRYQHGEQSLRQGKDSVGGSNLNYSAHVDFLRGSNSPLTAYVSAREIDSVIDAVYGDRTETSSQNLSAGISWVNSYFPMNFSFNRDDYRELYMQVGAPDRVRRDEVQSRYRLDGSSSKLKTVLERLSVRNRANPDAVYYDWDRASVSHRFRWGRGSALQTLLDFNDRSGSVAYRSFGLSESVSVTHTQALRSQASVRYFEQESQQAEGSENNLEARWRLQHRLYQNLDSHFEIRSNSRETDLQNQDDADWQVGADYRKRFADLIDVNLGLNYRSGSTDRTSLAGSEEILDEVHIASLSEPIVLKEFFVQQSTIRVVASSDGFVYAEGLDYEVLSLGGRITQIRINPGGQITEGERLLISYRYFVTPSVAYTYEGMGYHLSLAVDHFRFYHRQNRTDYDFESGFRIGLPPSEEFRDTGLQFSWRNARVSALVDLGHSSRSYGAVESETTSLVESLSLDISSKTSISINASQIFSSNRERIFPGIQPQESFPLRESEFEYLVLDGVMSYRPSPNVLIQPSLGYWWRKEQFEQGQAPNRQKNLGLQLIVQWQVRQLSLALRLSSNVRDENGLNSDQSRIFVSAMRTF